MTDHLDGGYAAAARRKEARAAARRAAADPATDFTAGGTGSAADTSSAAATELADSNAAPDLTAAPQSAAVFGLAGSGEPAAGFGSAGSAREADRSGGGGDAGGARGLSGSGAVAAGGAGGAGWWRRVRVRSAGGEWETAGERRTATVVLSVGLLLVGLLFAVAYRGTIRTAPESERARQALVRDVEAGSALSDSLQRQAETLSGQLVRERDAVLTRTETGERATREVRRLEAAAALVPVTGPGVKVVAGDASPQEQIDPATGQSVSVPADDSGRLRDRDLQSLVNALWAAGAEAVSVGGERLAPTTTIRAAGEAILVDLRPVTSPYAIEAIGDPDTLLPRFADSDAARRYQSYTGLYGITFTVTREQSLRLRAATGPELRYAEPASFAGGGS